MRRKKGIFFTTIGVGIALVLAAVYFFFFRSKTAGLLVESDPAAIVFINGEQVGRTPYESTQQVEEVIVKLVPEANQPLAPYETKVVLEAGIKTVVRRSFGETADTSAGEVISFEKLGAGETAVSVVSSPDAAQVAVDGQIKGFTPIKISDITAGDHQLAISSPGYIDRTFSVRTVEGFRLTAIVSLAKSGDKPDELAVFEDVKAQSEETTKKVKILETDTGFLRVREEATTASKEIGQVKPGQLYDLVEENTESGWYKIKFDDKEGWVSGEYASIQDE